VKKYGIFSIITLRLFTALVAKKEIKSYFFVKIQIWITVWILFLRHNVSLSEEYNSFVFIYRHVAC